MTDGFAERAELLGRLAESDLGWLDDLVAIFRSTLRRGGKILFVGNGGSAADAQHLAAEYVGLGLRALALTTDTSVLTALGNDFGFDTAFARQIAALADAADILVVHSTSGNSPNVVEAIEAAKILGVVTVGLTARGGGAVARSVDRSFVVPTDSTQLAQEIHLAIGHIIFDSVREALDG